MTIGRDGSMNTSAVVICARNTQKAVLTMIEKEFPEAIAYRAKIDIGRCQGLPGLGGGTVSSAECKVQNAECGMEKVEVMRGL